MHAGVCEAREKRGPGQTPYFTWAELNYSLGRPKLVEFVCWVKRRLNSAELNWIMKIKRLRLTYTSIYSNTLIIHLKKLPRSDWLKRSTFLVNTVQKSVTRVQITTKISEVKTKTAKGQPMYFEDRWRSCEAFRKLPKTTRNRPKISEDHPNNSEDFRRSPKYVWSFPKIARTLPKTYDNLRRSPKITGNLRRSPKITGYFRRFSKF